MTQRTYSDYYWLNDASVEFLQRGYLEEGEDPKKRYRIIAEAAERILGINGFADKFEGYLAKGYYSLSSPVISNFGNERGFAISCNGNYISDSMTSILTKVAETGILTKNGAGTSGYFGDLRPRGAKITGGGESSGPVHFMELYDCVTNVVSQSSVRRGSFAAYINVEHPDILDFLRIRSEGHVIQKMSIGVCIPNSWMRDMIGGNKEKRNIWAKIIQKRFETGYPYIFFTDTVNNNAPHVFKDKGLKIHASNLCSEIALHSSPDETFVCDLSSINLLHWDEIKNTDAVETLIFFLDAVMTEYIQKTEGIKFMESPNNFAKRQRALGLGVLGWHSLLQSKMISFESMTAKYLNTEIFRFLKDRCDNATRELAEMYGEPELLKGYGVRNVTTMAIAPTTSSSFILGQVSPSIEPENSNYYVKNLAKGKSTKKNPYLKELLQTYDKDTSEVWESILKSGGSVQHLDFLSSTEKDVFKNFGEISQKEIVIQAIQRQKYIDQSQSLNLMINGEASPKEVSQLLIFGWENGIKTFYYQRGTNSAQELGRKIMNCASCES